MQNIKATRADATKAPNGRTPRSHKITFSLPPAIMYSALISHSFIVLDKPLFKRIVLCKDDFDWNPNKKVYDNYITEIFDRNLSCVTSTWSEISQSFIDDASVYENIIKEYNQYANVFSNGFTEKIDDRTYERIRNNPALLLEYAKTHENAKPGADAYKYPNFTISMVEQARSVSVNYEETM